MVNALVLIKHFSTLPEHSKLVIQLASFTHVLLHLLSYNHLYLRLKMGAAVA